ncbi:MAG: 3-deoxy-manno-octulosonate-8-phosphatase KdsC [Gammaproteobacteria bacterium]|nr:3-deoxy-manno-octulosonate-8-phosphatase KdsC [Gammaproteobacteria bacterium]
MTEIIPLPFAVSDEVLERASKVRLVLFDVDGVMTDSSLFIGDDGQEYKAFNSKDGHGIKMMQRTGIDAGIITGRTSEVVRHRVRDLGIKHVFQGCADKLPVYEQLIKDLGISADQTAFVGDDVVDLPIMLRAGLAICVADGHALVKQHSHWVTPTNGGRGAVREVTEMMMFAHGKYSSTMEQYL